MAPPPETTPQLWIENNGSSGGKTSWSVGIEVGSVFNITSQTTCTCALGAFLSLSGLDINDASLAYTNIQTHEGRVLDAFYFEKLQKLKRGQAPFFLQ
ncbi:MAG: hypothetical protein COA42_14670 [Alteromonadaceae bacterium]|nr:hypothetical protein [Colwellia sp.]PCK07379.1 MAG: hypothetical protein COA42_14670 [Alteromonadaceae bacterium]